MIRTYPEALAFLEGLQPRGIRPGLATIRELCRRLEHPQQAYPTILVGGTNGKGSTARALALLLEEAGYRVGLYTSPHLVDFRERIQVQGAPIPPEAVVSLSQVLQKALGPDLHPTFFEATTALAFLYFQQTRVDLAVLEVGLGGRWDATNVVSPVVSVITGVDRDHMAFLGNRLRDIVQEKCGILRPGIPLVCGETRPLRRRWIEESARALGSPGFFWRRHFQTRRLAMGLEEMVFQYQDLEGQWSPLLHTPLVGGHQVGNLALALATADVLVREGWKIPQDARTRALARLRWPGRLEVLQQAPLILLDGAHNPAGARALRAFLVEMGLWQGPRRLTLCFGVLQDKEAAVLLRILSPGAHRVVLTRPPSPRGRDPEPLRAWVAGDREVQVFLDPREALAAVQSCWNPGDCLVVTGSLYLVGLARAFFQKRGGPSR